MPLASLLPCKKRPSTTNKSRYSKTYIACHKNRPKKYSIHEAVILEVDMVYNEETRM
jgi:hypothetical protein